MDTSKQQNSIRGVSEPPDGVVKFTVYGEPVPKARARTVTDITPKGEKVTHSYTPENTSIHEQKIALVYKSIYHGFKFREGVPLLFAVDVYLPIPKRTSKRKVEAMIAGEIRPVGHVGDVDNYEKCAADALLKIAYEDDCQIVEMTGRKFYSEQPRTEIYIASLREGEF